MLSEMVAKLAVPLTRRVVMLMLLRPVVCRLGVAHARIDIRSRKAGPHGIADHARRLLSGAGEPQWK